MKIKIIVLMLFLMTGACNLTSNIVATRASDTPIKTPTRIHRVDYLSAHKADGDILYDWFSYIPRKLEKDKKVYIWVTSSATAPDNNYDRVTSRVRGYAGEWKDYASYYGYVLLTPVIPRPKTDHIYVIAFNRRVFLPNTLPMYQRPDLELNKMIDKLTEILRQDGYDVSDKVFMDGYSAGGMFAQRYALLHPDRLMAVAGGQCGGSLTVPDSAYDWPVGIQDFEKLTGFAFKDADYQLLPQLYYIGDLDTNNSTVRLGGSDVFTEAQVEALFSRFGRGDPERLQNQVKHMNDLGYVNVTFHMYPGVRHDFTDSMILATFRFFDQYR